MSTHRTPSPTATRRRHAGRVALVAVATGGVLLAGTSAASAHVRVLPDTTVAGGFAELTFRVPTESDTAGTVGLRIELPTDTPLTSVRTRPVPGWTAVVERGPLPDPVERDGATITEAPTAVVWTADPGVQVAPGQYQAFAISVGPLPEAGTEVMLPATQTYSDGEVVAWAQEPAADGTEPELPAPVLVTTEAAGDQHAHGGTGTAGSVADTAASTDDGTGTAPTSGTTSGTGSGTVSGAASAGVASGDATDSGARWLGGAGLALGAAGLVAGIRRRPAPARPGA